MNERKFLEELHSQMRIAHLGNSTNPSFQVLERAVPRLSMLLRQLANDKQISPQFKDLLSEFIEADCYELHCIRNLMLGYHKLEQSGLNKRSEIRFIKEIHTVVDCLLLISDTMNNLRKHTRLLEDLMRQEEVTR